MAKRKFLPGVYTGTGADANADAERGFFPGTDTGTDADANADAEPGFPEIFGNFWIFRKNPEISFQTSSPEKKRH